MTSDQVSILLVFLFLMMTGFCTYLLLHRSRSSSPPTPTATSTPSTLSVDPTVEMARMMMETMREDAKENRRLMETLLLGRDQSDSPTSTSSTSSMELPTTFDYDSTPLSPGIEAVMSREAEEDLQEALMRERAEYQQRIMELERENLARLDRQAVEDSSPGPWLAPEGSSESPM